MSIVFVLLWLANSGFADPLPTTVKITPVGSHVGEFCRNDRALLFEDPTGVRILWDPGRTIAGGTDDRLGAVHVMLLSHAHTDHIGDVRHNPTAAPREFDGSGACTNCQ